MAKGANGTIDLDSFTQVTKQREAITTRNTAFANGKRYGLATDRLDTLFTNSPLLVENREADPANDRGGLYTNADGDIYKAYAAAVDTTITGGFGFRSTDTTNLDYRGSTAENKNPFLNADESAIDYTSLTTGNASGETGEKRRFLGFPDLDIPDNISNGNISYSDSSSTSNASLAKTPTNNFGSTTSQDRDKINELYAGTDLRGTFEADGLRPDTSGEGEASNAIDNLGKYFTKNYT